MIAPGWLRAAVGAAGVAAAAWPLHGTFLGGLAWVIACAVACAGHGGALARVTGAPLAPALAAAAGLAAMLVSSTILGALGLFSGPVQRAIVLLGVALAALPRGPWDPEPARAGAARFRRVVGALAALLLVALALVRLETPVGDGANHVLAVKRLWDTGALAGAPHTSGLYVAGEALLAWGGGAAAAGVLEAFCAALLVLVIAAELSAEDTLAARLALALAAAVIILEPPTPGQMPATLFHLAAILALRAPLEERRTGWHTVGFAAALALLRHEFVFLAVPYAAAAVVLPRLGQPSRRQVGVWLALAAWLAISFGLGLALGLPPGNALGKAFAMLAAAPLAALLLRLFGALPWRGPHGAACFALASYLLAVVAYAIPPARHSATATVAVMTAVALLVLVASVAAAASAASTVSGAAQGLVPSPRPAAGWLHPAAASLVIAIFASTTLLLPAFENDRVGNRFATALIALRERLALGSDRPHDFVHAAQLRAPAGARLAFWGVSAARLDFARNPIRDVSFSGRILRAPLAPPALAGADYLLLEDLRAAPRYDRQTRITTFPPALEAVADRLEYVATEGTAHLFRVRD